MPPQPPAAAAGGSQGALDALARDAIVWASQHGLVVGLGGEAPPDALIHAPLSLLPVAFPEARFKQAKAAMTAFSHLIDAVARDEAYLTETLAPAAAQDDFTARLLRLLADSAPVRRAAAAPGGAPEVVLGVHRSDYMLDAPSGRFLQVELNTIAASFGCLSTITSQLHAHTLARLAAAARVRAAAVAGTGAQPQQPQLAGEPPLAALERLLSPQRLPANDAMAGIARALAAAVRAAGGPGAVMVMVVQPGERNAYDQQWLQHTLWEQHGVETHRLSLTDIPDALRLQPLPRGQQQGAQPQQQDAQQQQQQQQLVLATTGQVVGLVYFRAGYTPNDYPSEREWQARALVESSTAAKCPSAAYQLAGCKKVQQDLARPGVVERFVGDATGAELRQLFAGLWSLDNPAEPATAAVIADALQNPGRYVLKPQREGGGNNLYGPQLVAQLRRGLGLDPDSGAEGLGSGGGGGGSSLAAFILMQRIVPPPQRGVFVRAGRVAADEALSELGIFGTFLRVGGEVRMCEEVGHLVRTKTASSDEGGVAAGFAVLDSPLLAVPGEGLLHPLLEGATEGAAQQPARGWGAAGGVLALAQAALDA